MVRIKNRYFVTEISTLDKISETTCLPINGRNILEAVKESLQRFHGDYGLGSCIYGMTIKMFNPLTRLFILRVHRGCHPFVASTLPFVNKINGLKVKLTVLHFAGTIRSCLKFIVVYDIKKLDELIKLCNDQDLMEKAKVIMKECQKQLTGDEDLQEET
ncbi:ribonuclease P/MRP protein subunit POP5 [Centruroides vittatus]|uniref:ribonuclease P/MRP protein subunit POP5 n=1 Tax=Centruroides vittatus TaxID=120091 RepID=UPI00350F36E1